MRKCGLARSLAGTRWMLRVSKTFFRASGAGDMYRGRVIRLRGGAFVTELSDL